MTNDSLITTNSAVMLGKPVIRGTRITVQLIQQKVAGGATIEVLLEMYPHLTTEGIRAALDYPTGSVDYNPKG